MLCEGEKRKRPLGTCCERALSMRDQRLLRNLLLTESIQLKVSGST